MERDAATDEWTGLAFRGMIAVLFGVAATFWPELTLKTLVYLFGGFIVASGLVSLVVGLSTIYNNDRSFLVRLLGVVIGVVEIAVGVYLLRHPAVSLQAFILIIGFTLVGRGLIDIIMGLFEVRGAMHKTVMIIGGLLAGIFGVALLFQPVAGGIAFVWILGLYALLTGPMLIALALDIKNNNKPPGLAIKPGRASRA